MRQNEYLWIKRLTKPIKQKRDLLTLGIRLFVNYNGWGRKKKEFPAESLTVTGSVSQRRSDSSVKFPSLLTLSQTKKFRLFQTERVCRRQFRVW